MKLIKKLNSYLLPFYVGLIYFFLYIPVIVLVVFSFNKSSISYSWTGFTFDWYVKLFQTTQIWLALSNSIIVGTCAVLFSTIMGTLIVWGWSVKHKYFITVFYSTMMIPDVVIAVGLLIFFTFFSVPLGLTTLIAGHTLIGLGLVVPIVYSRFIQLDYQVIEASLNLGASEWQTFIKVILPFKANSLISLEVIDFVVFIFLLVKVKNIGFQLPLIYPKRYNV